MTMKVDVCFTSTEKKTHEGRAGEKQAIRSSDTTKIIKYNTSKKEREQVLSRKRKEESRVKHKGGV